MGRVYELREKYLRSCHLAGQVQHLGGQVGLGLLPLLFALLGPAHLLPLTIPLRLVLRLNFTRRCYQFLCFLYILKANIIL